MIIRNELEQNTSLERAQETSDEVGFSVVYRRILDAKLPLLIFCILTISGTLFGLSQLNKKIIVTISDYKIISTLDEKAHTIVNQFWDGDENRYKEDLLLEFVNTFNQELEPQLICSFLDETTSSFLKPFNEREARNSFEVIARFVGANKTTKEIELCESRLRSGLVSTRFRSSSKGFEIEISCDAKLDCASEIEAALLSAIAATISNSLNTILRQVSTDGSEMQSPTVENCGISCEGLPARTSEVDYERAADPTIDQSHTTILTVKLSEISRSKRHHFDFSITNILAISYGCCLFVFWLMTRLDAARIAASRFISGEEFDGKFSAPLIGSIPIIPIKSRRELIRYFDEKPTSIVVEAVRNIRTSLLLSGLSEQPKVILSTSSVPGEGKTTLAIGLSHSLANLGKKVLLIEGDNRRRTLAEYFPGLKENRGIISVLLGDLSLDEAVVQSPELNADLLLGQKSNANPADIYSSLRFQDLINQAREQYDYIVIDAPPVLVVPDARAIGQHCDAIVCSVKWDQTSQSQVGRLDAEIRAVNLKVTGFVLNQIDLKRLKRYGFDEQVSPPADYYEII